MVQRYLCCMPFIVFGSLICILLVCTVTVHGQSPVNLPVKQTVRSFNDVKKITKDTITVDFNNPFRKLFNTRPAFRVNGGLVCYNANYRSIIDTPYAEKSILQHNVTGRWDVTVAGIFPIQVNYWLRQSNSRFFRNIYDVQVSFNGNEFQQKIKASMRERMLALAPSIKDTLLEKAHALKLADLTALEKRLKTLYSAQKLIEANETLKVPKLTWDNSLPDSVNQHREDSLRGEATFFLSQYADTKQQYDQLHTQVDSLKHKYQENLKKVNQYRQMIQGNWNEMQSARAWKNKLEEYGMQDMNIPAKYRWLLGVRCNLHELYTINRSDIRTVIKTESCASNG